MIFVTFFSTFCCLNPSSTRPWGKCADADADADADAGADADADADADAGDAATALPQGTCKDAASPLTNRYMVFHRSETELYTLALEDNFTARKDDSQTDTCSFMNRKLSFMH